jgi:hypothetical protein
MIGRYRVRLISGLSVAILVAAVTINAATADDEMPVRLGAVYEARTGGPPS